MADILDITDVTMPMLSADMTEGRILRWFVREGQTVEPGDLLAEVAFGSSTVEVEATSHGRVAALLYAAGADAIKAHSPIALFEMSATQESQAPEASMTVAPAHSATPAVTDTSHIEHAIDRALKGNTSMLSYREALRDALHEAMSHDARVVVLGEDVTQNRGAQRVTQGLHDTFGEARVVPLRPFDDAAFSIAVGAALGGCIPVVEVSSWGTALEAMTAALDTATTLPVLSGHRVSVPLVVRGPYGWTSGAAGGAAAAVAARLAQVPRLKIVVPSTPASAKLLLSAALRDGGPVAILESEDLYQSEGPVPSETIDDVIGTAHIARAGSQVTLVTYGRLLSRSLAVAERLSTRGISIEVVDLLSLRPIDTATVKTSLRTTRRLLVVEDGPVAFGIGAEIISGVAADPGLALDAPPVQLGGVAPPIPYSSAFDAVILPTDERIELAIMELLGRGLPG